ncbi:MAG: hypothetical protein WCO26_07930 [Deltaproteobacteria bacterium]
MIENLLQEEDLLSAILSIIADYQPITTADIWFELGEDDGFEGKMTQGEVEETLFQLEKQNRIVKGEDDKWKIKQGIAKYRLGLSSI